MLVTAYGITSAITKVLVGLVSDVCASSALRIWLYACGVASKGLATAVTPVVLSTTHVFVSSVGMNALYGVSDGVQVALYAPVIRSLVGSAHMVQAMGLQTALVGLASIVSPSIGGVGYDLLHSYTLPFALAGSLMCASALLFCLLDTSPSPSPRGMTA